MTHAAEDKRACQIFLEFVSVIIGIIAGMWLYEDGHGWRPFWAVLAAIVIAILAGWLLKQLFCRLLGLGRGGSEGANASMASGQGAQAAAASASQEAPKAAPAATPEAAARAQTASVAKTAEESAEKAAAAQDAGEASETEQAAAASGDTGAGGGSDASGETSEGVRPANLMEKPKGQPDDLKKIKGVGPKLEKMLNEMGIWHFWQIAEWGPDEVAWVDQHLPAFKGRVSRDHWVEQARILAAGGETDFSRRVEEGEVYDEKGDAGRKA